MSVRLDDPAFVDDERSGKLLCASHNPPEPVSPHGSFHHRPPQRFWTNQLPQISGFQFEGPEQFPLRIADGRHIGQPKVIEQGSAICGGTHMDDDQIPTSPPECRGLLLEIR